MRPKLTRPLLSVSRRSSDYPHGATAIDRFWRYVQIGDPDDCWPWVGADNGVGYGVFNVGGWMYVATHISWFLAGNELGDGQMLCHSCDNPPCVNPVHLFPGSDADNHADMVAKGRSTRGDRNANAQLTWDDVATMRALYVPRHKEFGVTALAARFGVGKCTVSLVVRGLSWKDAP